MWAGAARGGVCSAEQEPPGLTSGVSRLSRAPDPFSYWRCSTYRVMGDVFRLESMGDGREPGRSDAWL